MKNFRILGTLVLFILALSVSALAQNVNVTATAGTPAATYPTLNDAFSAINAGTHQGAITVEIAANTTEPGPAVLNSNAAAPASYTSVLIRPVADGVTVSGATATGRGLIELNGADGVTIDGDNPNTAGTNRNLTLQNTAVNTITFTSVIRVALATTIITSADNDTFRNLNILGSATGRNAAANTATATSLENVYGILAAGGASTVSQTTAPTAISSLTSVAGSGATANNLTIQNNFVNTAARAVSIQGSAATVFPGLLIENNTIGNATAGAVDQVYQYAVSAQGTNNAIVRGNTVYVESFLGFISATGTTALFEKNKVLRVRNNNVGTFGAYGINLAGGNTHTVQNNFVADVRNDQTAGTGAFSTTFGAMGIRVGSGTGHIVRHNSVHLFGAMSGAVSTDLVAAFAIVATTQTGCDVRNNIFSNQLTGGNPTQTNTRFVAIFLPSGATVAMNLTINNNGYYVGSSVNSRLAQVGTTTGTGEYTVANFDPSSTAPATNFRAYTAPLSAAGTNDNASFAVTGPPPFISNTDLHIVAASVTRLESGGAPLGVIDDIDAQTRSATTPDIGADEFVGTPLPANDIAANAFVTPANGGLVANGTSISPQASFTNAGSAAQASVSVQFTITGPGGYNYTNTQVIPTINPGQTITVTFAAAPAFTTAGTYNMTASVITPDSNTGNDIINGTFTVVNPVGGTVTVGTGGTYPSLTNPGGLFQAINTIGANANITINIVSDLTGETGAVMLNEVAGGFTVTIKPSGAPRTISGTSAAAAGLLGFNATDNVTIDGSLSGGTDRSLTILSNNAGSTGGNVYFASGANGAQNNTVKNLNIRGASSENGPLLGITFAGSTFGAVGTDNDNNRIENNDVRGVFYGIASLGASAANPDANTIITRNVMPGTGTSGIARVGIYIINTNNAQITENNITSVATALGVDCIGIAAGTQAVSTTAATPADMTNTLIARNYVGVVSNTGTFSSAGIVIASGLTGTNTVVNNMLTGVKGDANAGDIVVGIYVIPRAGATQNIFHNSVSMTGDRGTTADQYPSYGLVITADLATNVFDNILVNSQTRTGAVGGGGQSYAVGIDVATFANITSNYNDLFVSGPLGVTGITTDLTTPAQTTTAGTGVNRVSLADWQTAIADDANSVAVNPLFTSLTDLHLTNSSPVRNIGTPTTPATTNDYDNDPRPLKTNPDIGADELIVSSTGNPIPAGTYYNVGVNFGSTLAGNVTVTGVLNLNSNLNTGGNTLTVGCGAVVNGAGLGAFVYGGTVVKQYCAPGSFVYPVGTLTDNRPNGGNIGFIGAYTPVTANVTALGINPSSLAVSVTDSFMPGVDTANSIDRFWTLTETGDLTTDLTFQYTNNDVNGNENLYKVLRRSGGTTVASQSSTVNTGANTASITGVSNFSDWSVGLSMPVTASIDIAGRVIAADGNTGLPRTRVTIAGSTLSQPRTVMTNPFGYYSFEDLPVGTYVLTVESKQYTFSVPSRVITADDNITNADFISNE